MWICANDERIRYTGRIDCRVEAEPVWVFPGSSAEFWFSGEVLRIHVENFNEYWQNYLGCILDQVQSAFYLKKSGGCRRMSLGCIMCCFLRGRMGVMS